MIAIDTNVIVRLLTRDDEAQYEAAYALFGQEEIFIPDSVVLETEWVLRYAYDFGPADICAALRKLFGLRNVHLADDRLLAKVITWHEQGMDFADALHLAHCEHLEHLKTFDEKFVKKAKGLSECSVERP